MTSIPIAPEGLAPRPVVCIGAVHWDMVVHASRQILPDTSTPGRLTQGPGGVATNVARAVKKLGATTHLIGAVGDDPAGRALEDLLAAEHISSHLLHLSGAMTGHYLALHNPDGSLPAACIDDQLLAAIDPAAFAAKMKECQADRLANICFLDANLSAAQAEAILGTIDPETMVAADAVSAAKAPRLAPHLPHIGLLFLNRAEAIALTGLREDVDISSLIKALHDKGSHAVALTDGAHGLWLGESRGEILHFSPPSVAVTDVTGAGDALIAGMLSALNRGHPLAASGTCGLAAAALTLQATGAAPDSLTWEAVSPTT
ncbi:carbohydrate kinase family protein [Roseibium sp. CAU 1637]|uniref:Carbohydrate kinase family protein n=1 Tax=Roseibium limicola TaxID=2816037 RepID=A0A939EN62_9HYPH|nr:carbohydrate kinase family protein [Roseibium limicola]MBO0344957.1 carbohydrate kinase family protein [Roseibium limicola]